MECRILGGWIVNCFPTGFQTIFLNMLFLAGRSCLFLIVIRLKTAAENDVILFCLPPHTTADSQPLDTSCFGPLKTYWVETCRQFIFSNPGRAISKFQFSKLFSEAWSKGMSTNNIISGFRCTGIYPFNPSIILRNCQKTLNRKLMMMKLVCPWSLVRGGSRGGSLGSDEPPLLLTALKNKAY